MEIDAAARYPIPGARVTSTRRSCMWRGARQLVVKQRFRGEFFFFFFFSFFFLVLICDLVVGSVQELRCCGLIGREPPAAAGLFPPAEMNLRPRRLPAPQHECSGEERKRGWTSSASDEQRVRTAAAVRSLARGER